MVSISSVGVIFIALVLRSALAGTPVTQGGYCQCTSAPSYRTATSSQPPQCKVNNAAQGTVFCDSTTKRYNCYAGLEGYWTSAGGQWVNWDFDYTQSQCVNSAGDEICKVGTVESCVEAVASSYNPYTQTTVRAFYYSACWEGFETGVDLKCTPCQSGRYRGNTESNTHLINAGVFCRACPAGFAAAGTAYKVCDSCVSGQYQTSCSKEDSDSNGNNDGCIRCKNCPEGKYQAALGQSTCVSCGKGKYSSEIASSTNTCKSCLAGFYADDEGSGLCSSCPRGWKSALGAQLCVACDSGKFSAVDGSSSCTSCPAGKITATSAQTSCEACSAGKETDKQNGLGGKICIPCASGKYENNAICEVCPLGWNQKETTTSACIECPIGRFAASIQTAVDCTACIPSKFQSLTRQTSCDDCTAGLYTNENAENKCKGCPMGFSSSVAASSCTGCVAGKFQSLPKKSACVDCQIGKYSDAVGSIDCVVCGSTGNTPPKGGMKAYQDDVGQITCKQCQSAGETASASREVCTSCAGSLGPNSYVDSLGACQICQGCATGSFKSQCTATSTCSDCPSGWYKDTIQTGINNNNDKGVGWDEPCTLCTSCSQGKFRPSSSQCMSSGAQSNDLTLACSACTTGFYKAGTGNFDDSCDPCTPCTVGATRTACGPVNVGICSPWSKPTVTEVSGSGKTGGDTEGIEILNIFGKNFGYVRKDAEAVDVVVRYGPENPPTSYIANKCEVLTEPQDTSLQHIRCETAAGVGKDHKLTVQIGLSDPKFPQQKPLLSDTFVANIAYAAPIVAIYSGPGANNAITSGGQTLIITGTQFGPLGTEIEDATYGNEDYQLNLDVSKCSVTVAHKEITCITSAGAGLGLKLVLKIGNQFSTIPAINYGAPQLKTQKCVDDDKSGKYLEGTTFCGCGSCPWKLIEGEKSVPAMTIGNGSCWLRADKPTCTDGRPIPVSTDYNGAARLSTQGGQLILISGINMGRSGVNSELESVTYGPVGTEISIPVVDTLPNDKAACRVYVATFSILCRTDPGIAGPHKWIVTVSGQASQEILQTQYRSPQINNADYTRLGTLGNEKIFLTGTEFGTLDINAKFRVIFVKGTATSDCTGVATPCYSIVANAAIASDGYERLEFSSPSGYGTGWNIRLLQTNLITGQSVFADFDGTVQYSKPVIDSVTVSAGPLSDGLHRVTIVGQNFCDRTVSGANCGMVYRCGNGVDFAYCQTNPEDSIPESIIESWTDSRIKVKVPVSAGIVYVQTGLGGSGSFSGLEGFKSAFRSFNTNAMTIVAGFDFTLLGGDLVYNKVIPTQGGDRLCCEVQKLDGDQKVQIEVNGIKTDYIPVDEITSPANGRQWKVCFNVPQGMGERKRLVVTKDGAPTTNRAYISYGVPLISTITVNDVNKTPLVKDNRPGIVNTMGNTEIIISGSNFGDPSKILIGDYEVRFRSTDMSVDEKLTKREEICTIDEITKQEKCEMLLSGGHCSTHTDDKIVCTLPANVGVGYVIDMVIGGQKPNAGVWPETGMKINYAPPKLIVVTPKGGPTKNPGTIQFTGENFGTVPPSVKIQNKTCVVQIKSTGGYDTSFACVVADGEGKNHEIDIVVGTQRGTETQTFSYDKPVITNFEPKMGLTSGLDTNGNRQIITLEGSNFGTNATAEVRIFFETTEEDPTRTFVVEGNDLLSRTHTQIKFYQVSVNNVVDFFFFFSSSSSPDSDSYNFCCCFRVESAPPLNGKKKAIRVRCQGESRSRGLWSNFFTIISRF